MSSAGSRWHLWGMLTGQSRGSPSESPQELTAKLPPGREISLPGNCLVNRLWMAATVGTVFILALLVFRALLLQVPWKQLDSDFRIHIGSVLTGNVANAPLRFGSYPMFQWATKLALALAPEQGWEGARQGAMVVLALALAARTWLTYRELRGALSAAGAATACLLLAVAMSLPNGWRSPSDEYPRVHFDGWLSNYPSVWFGMINPNVWHNPTTILAAPFALLLFHQAILYLEAPGPQLAFSVGVGSVLCGLAKPSFLLAFLPSFGLAMLASAFAAGNAGRLSARTVLLHGLAAFALPVALLAWQAWYTFGFDQRLEWNPFATWSIFVDSPPKNYVYWVRPQVLLDRLPRALLLGLAFPLAVALCFPRQLWRDRRALFAWLILAVALAEYALLAEPVHVPNGTYPIVSGNLSWALVPAAYIVFMESCRVAGRQPFGITKGLCFGILTLHAASGVICVARAMLDPSNALLF